MTSIRSITVNLNPCFMKYLFICFVIIWATACQYHCDGYYTDRTEVLAFRLGDSIVYKSNKSDTIILVVNDFHAEGASSHSAVMVMDYQCPKDAYYTTTTDIKHGISIKEFDTQDSSTSGQQILFCNSDDYELVTWKKDYKSKNMDSLIVNNTVYRNVREIEDLTGNRRISSFVKAWHYGIIKFYDSQENLTWEQIKIIRKQHADI